MHIEKNIYDNLLGTFLNLDGKSKDNMKARLDLKEMGIRQELHPQLLAKIELIFHMHVIRCLIEKRIFS